MAELAESCFSSPWSSLDHTTEMDPFAINPADVEMSCGRRARPCHLTFKGQDTPFSDPWVTTRPLTPLDQDVPQWFQRRKLALVPENVNSPEESPRKTLDQAVGISMATEQQSGFVVPRKAISHQTTVKRPRSNVDIADQFARDALMLEQLNSCGQVVDELMRLPAVQTLLSRKRKAEAADELGMDDMRATWKRRNVRTDSCHFDSGSSNNGQSGKGSLLTAADFGSWNFGFELHLTTGWC